jgi:hypothetical protein
MELEVTIEQSTATPLAPPAFSAPAAAESSDEARPNQGASNALSSCTPPSTPAPGLISPPVQTPASGAGARRWGGEAVVLSQIVEGASVRQIAATLNAEALSPPPPPPPPARARAPAVSQEQGAPVGASSGALVPASARRWGGEAVVLSQIVEGASVRQIAASLNAEARSPSPRRQPPPDEHAQLVPARSARDEPAHHERDGRVRVETAAVEAAPAAEAVASASASARANEVAPFETISANQQPGQLPARRAEPDLGADGAAGVPARGRLPLLAEGALRWLASASCVLSDQAGARADDAEAAAAVVVVAAAAVDDDTAAACDDDDEPRVSVRELQAHRVHAATQARAYRQRRKALGQWRLGLSALPAAATRELNCGASAPRPPQPSSAALGATLAVALAADLREFGDELHRAAVVAASRARDARRMPSPLRANSTVRLGSNHNDALLFAGAPQAAAIEARAQAEARGDEAAGHERVWRAIRLVAARGERARAAQLVRAWLARAAATGRALARATARVHARRLRTALRELVGALGSSAVRRELRELRAEVDALTKLAALQRDALLVVAVDMGPAADQIGGAHAVLEQSVARSRPIGAMRAYAPPPSEADIASDGALRDDAGAAAAQRRAASVRVQPLDGSRAAARRRSELNGRRSQRGAASSAFSTAVASLAE